MTIKRYRAKNIPIREAVVWTGTNIEEIRAICPQALKRTDNTVHIFSDDTGDYYIAQIGDMVIRDIFSGRPYYFVCEASDFLEFHEEV